MSVQQCALAELGVAPDRIYTHRGLTGTNRSRPGLDQALAAVRRGDTLLILQVSRYMRHGAARSAAA
ncbi:recombinase family protein [Paraburkholderia sediminicola]|uniref:recombinase family protein n=1 Tax=Paraburkholderia sediminicola TaxID=458836 RepID=UPI0038B9F2BF